MKKWLLTGIFAAVAVLLGLSFYLKKAGIAFENSSVIGETGYIDISVPSDGTHNSETYYCMGLVVQVDNKKGYTPSSTDAGYNAVEFYKDWQPSLGTSDMGFFVLPQNSTLDNRNTEDMIAYAWYDSSSTKMNYYKDSPWNKAVVGLKKTPVNHAGGIFKPKLKEIFDKDGTKGLLQWETLFSDPSYIEESIKQWRYFAGDGKTTATETRIRQYMGIEHLDINNISSWSSQDREDAFLAYLDLLLTCRYAVGYSTSAAPKWTDIVNGYLNEGPTQTHSDYNLVISPGMIVKTDKVSGREPKLICTGVTDGIEWAYSLQKGNTLSLRENGSLVSAIGYLPKSPDGQSVYLQYVEAIARNYESLGKPINEYPAATDLGYRYTLHGLSGTYNFAAKQITPDGNSLRLLEKMWISDKEGNRFFGKMLILANPLAESKLNMSTKSAFKVHWTSHGGNYFSTHGSNVGDSVSLIVSLETPKEEIAAWDSICNTYDKFYLSFNVKSPGNGTDVNNPRHTETTKSEQGVTSGLNNPEFTIDGTPYTVGKKVEVSKEFLRKFVKGEIQYTKLYDKSTNAQVIAMGELQHYGYDLNVTIYYEDATGTKGGQYETAWTGWTTDTANGDRKGQESHAVTVFREEDNPEKITWYSSPEAYAELKEGTVDYKTTSSHEAWEAMAGVPSTEMLYFASGGSEFIVELELERVEGEEGQRQYISQFMGTECEFKHNDAFWQMETKDGSETYKEHDLDNNEKSVDTKSPNADLQQGEHIIEKFLVADETGQDTNVNYSSKTPVQWYKWAIAGTGQGDHGTTASVTQNEVLSGHTHSWEHNQANADKNMNSSTVTATWTGIIWNQQGTKSEQAPSSSHISGYEEANPAPDCQGGKDGYAGDFNETDTYWDISGYHSAIDQAKKWAEAYEKTNESYTAKMLADSDDYSRVWRIGNATIDVSFSGGESNQGSGSRPAGSYTTSNIDSVKKPGDQASWGYNFSFSHGTDGTAGTHGDSQEGDPPVTVPHGNDKDGTATVGSTVNGVGDIRYTIRVTFDNGTLDAHELCGTCCQHDLPIIYDSWVQRMKYDYARLNVCRVYKIHRAYVDGVEEITFSDYNDAEDLADGGDHEMYSGAIRNYTVDTGAFSAEDRFETLDVRDENRSRQVLTADEQAKLHNGTDTIVAAINQGDPNIFYNIAMMSNIEDDYFHSYANEIENNQISMMNSLAGRVRYSLGANMHHIPEWWEHSQRGNYTGQLTGTDGGYNLTEFSSDAFGGATFFGSRSNKCDGMTETYGSSNQIQVKANGHAKPIVTLGGESGEWFSMFNGGKSTDIKNFSNGLIYNRWGETWSGLHPDYVDSASLNTSPVTFYYDKAQTKYWITDDENWMATTAVADDYGCTSLVYPGTIETNGGGQWNGSGYDYPGYDQANNATNKTKYTANSIDAIDFQTEEYHRIRYRRNMRNTAYVISDMLILQTSTGDQPVMYHWKSQTKRTQQHYDYTVSDVDVNMAKYDSEITGSNITLTEPLKEMWNVQKSGNQNATNSAVTMTALGWGINNIGTDGAINVGGYLGLYSQPDRKFSSGVNNSRISTLFDSDPYGLSSASANGNFITGTQGDNEDVSDSAVPTFNVLATNFPVHTDYHYPKSVAHTGAMDFGGNKAATAKFIERENNNDLSGYTFTGVGSSRSDKFYSFSVYHAGPQNLWRYATTVDNPNPDMYKASAGAAHANFGENGTNFWRASGMRMAAPAGALRIVTDKIQQDPTNENKKYETGTATQTYMKILDFPAVDIGDMNYVDITTRQGSPYRYEFTKRNRTFKSKFLDEDVYVTDMDRVDREGTKRYPGHVINPNGAGSYNIIDGYTVEAVYSKQHNKINDIVVHNPISVEDSYIDHNLEAENNKWYADTRTGAEDLTSTSLQDKLDKLGVCSGNPDTCEFKVLKCSYGEDEVVFSSDFDTGVTVENGKTYVKNLAKDKKYELPSGFSVIEGIERINSDGDIYYYKPFAYKNFLSCFGTRWSIPLSDLGITYDADTQLKVDMDFYLDDKKTTGTMVVSFFQYDFYIPGGKYAAIPTWNTGNGWERKYETVNLYDKELKLSLIFDFSDVYESKVFINGVQINNVTIVNNSAAITENMVFGGNSTLNIGSWGIDDGYPAQFFIDNLQITKLAKGREHTDACYQIVKEHEKAQEYTCGITETFYYAESTTGTSTHGKPYVFVAPQSGTYRLEAWGAAGGGASTSLSAPSAGGLGGYSRGYVTLQKGESVMIYPGGAGSSKPTTSTGIEYFWILTDGCGNYTNWSQTYTTQMSGINYINSVTGKEEKTGVTLPGVWAATIPSGFTCSNHSVSVAIDSSTGKMVQRVAGGSSGSTPVLTTWDYGYTGNTQTFTAPQDGLYTLEAWGASGGGHNANMTGQGGYTKGTVKLRKGQTIYVYVGEQGKYIVGSGEDTAHTGTKPASATYNGGGDGGYSMGNWGYHLGGSGGGATDFRLVNGTWNNTSSLQSRILVAGGGGGCGCASGHNPGHGGGLVGAGTNNPSGTYAGAATSGGSQTAGGTGIGKYDSQATGSFGIGANAAQCAAGGGGGYYGGGSEYTAGGSGGSSFVTGYSGCDTTYRAQQGNFTFSNVVMNQGGNTGNGKAKISLLGGSSTNTFAGAGFNGGGSSGVNGYGGGGASDVRKLSSGGEYVLKGASSSALETMDYNGTKYVKVFDHDVTIGGVFTGTNEASNCSESGKFSILNTIDNLKSDGKYQFMLVYPEMNKRNIWKQSKNPLVETIADTTNGSKVSGYEAVQIEMNGNYWGGLAKSTLSVSLLDGSVGHGNWWYAVGATSYHPNTQSGTIPGGDSTNVTQVQLWMACDEDAVNKANEGKTSKPMMIESGVTTYGPYDTASVGTYQVDIYGQGLADCTFDVYDNALGGIIYNHDQLKDMKISPTHVSFYFDMPYDTVGGSGKGLEVRVQHANSSTYVFDSMFLSRLEDRIIVAGGGGGADDSAGTVGGTNDGSGGSGGGTTGGNAKVDGQLTRPGVALSTKLQAEVNKIKDSNGAWKAIEGISMSGCGLGGGQTYGYALGRGESVSYTTDTGGAGGGYYGGFVTNHYNGGGGGGSGYVSPELSDTVMINGANDKDGKVRVALVAHENLNEYSQTYGYTGSVQTWTAPESGEYRIEAWGAAGGDGRTVNEGSVVANSGGAGGYTSIIKSFSAGEKIYLYVGEKGKDNSSTAGASYGAGGWNGGGDGATDPIDGSYPESGAGGGGMTHISTSNSDDVDNGVFNTSSVLLVAAGGGGSGSQPGSSGRTAFGGSGGGFIGNTTNKFSKPGTQLNGYKQGVGKNGLSESTSVTSGVGTGGAGGGWYGGYWLDNDKTTNYGLTDRVGGAGGSSYIKSGLLGGKVLDGSTVQPSKTDADATQLGNRGNGAVRISKINRSHNSTCTFKSTNYNYHAHNKDCFYDGSELNAALKGALLAEYNGDTSLLRGYLGEEVYDKLHQNEDLVLASLYGFTQTDFKGLRMDAYGNDIDGTNAGYINRGVLTSDAPSGDTGKNGNLILTPTATDSWVALDTYMSSGAITEITAKVKYEGVNPGTADLYWKTSTQGYSESQRVAATVENTGDYQTLTWRLDGKNRTDANGNPIEPNYTNFKNYVNWKGTITGLRFDFIGNNVNQGKVYIKDISFKGSGATDTSTMASTTLIGQELNFATDTYGAVQSGQANMSKTAEGLRLTGRFYGIETTLPVEAEANAIQFVSVDFKVNSGNFNSTFGIGGIDENGNSVGVTGINNSVISRPWKHQYETQNVTIYVGDLWRGKNIKNIMLDVAQGDTVQNGDVTILNVKLYGHGDMTEVGMKVKETFNYTGGVQTYTPKKTASYYLDVYGASGGGGPTTEGSAKGLGGRSAGYKTLTAGQTYYIFVGGQGTLASAMNTGGGYNGGGQGGPSGFGGGGMSHISTTNNPASSSVKTNTVNAGSGTRDFAYTGGVQSFTAPVTGNYTLEVWGATGGGWGNYSDTPGGYSKGTVYLTAGQTIYICVGGSGKSASHTQIGSGSSYNGGGKTSAHGGGGATHIAKASGTLSSLVNNKSSVLIVAGGAGSNGYWTGGGLGGGLEADPVWYSTTGSNHVLHYVGGGQTQKSDTSYYYAGSFGQAPNSSITRAGCGGGGWYAGATCKTQWAGGAGGSGYIGGVSNGISQSGTAPLGDGKARITWNISTTTYTPQGSWNPTGTIIVAGGGGGADNRSGVPGDGDDGSGGTGGGTNGGNAKIAGVAQSGTAGTQTSGYMQGAGESASRVTDTGGAGAGWYGGKATNHNNGGAGGGSGYVNGLSSSQMQNGVRDGNGVVYITSDNPTKISKNAGQQVLSVKYASSFVTDPNNLDACVEKIAQYTDSVTNNQSATIPREIGGTVNPIYSCFAYGYNTHVCTEKCEEENKVLVCEEPHHSNMHYETTEQAIAAKLAAAKQSAINQKQKELEAQGKEFTDAIYNEVIAEVVRNFDPTGIHSCYEACNNDENHKNHSSQITDNNGNKVGEVYINTDEYFDIIFPNTGDFAENPTLHGIGSTVETRGMGYEDNMDPGKYVYQYPSQNADDKGHYVSWVRERYVRFSFDVLFYRAETGYWEQYSAYEWIELPVEGTNNRTGYPDDEKWDDGHPRYHFYCTLNNDEKAAAKVEFESEAINCRDGYGKYNEHDKYDISEGGFEIRETITKDLLYLVPYDRLDRAVYNPASNHVNDNDNIKDATNRDRRVNLTSLHGAHVTKYVDLVGRIGNMMITSTSDIRFINFFKRPNPNGSYLINGVVQEVFENIQRDYLSWHWNNGQLAYDVRHRQVSKDTAMYNTWGSNMWKGSSVSDEYGKDDNKDWDDNQVVVPKPSDTNGAADVVQNGSNPSALPLASDRNNINVYRNEQLKPGYTINYEITTTGNYESRVQIKPYFYALDLDTGKLKPIDVYMKTDDEYLGINYFGAADGLPLTWSDGSVGDITDEKMVEKLNSYILSLDWNNEAELRMYTDLEKQLTHAIHDNFVEYRTDDENGNDIHGDITGDNLLEPEPVRIPSGDFFELGNLQSQIVTNKARTYIGTRYTMYENFRHSNTHTGPLVDGVTACSMLHDTNLWDKVNDLEYTKKAQRWHLKLGLPSSAVFTLVENGVHYEPFEDKVVNGEKMKAYEEVANGNYVIVMTANIKSMGDIWNLYYTQEANNGVFNIGGKTYRIETDFYEYTTGNVDDSQVVLAIYENKTTSEVDVDTIGTH